MLVRAGPALGLMGTLIPLSPALTGLANGDTATLSQDLRVAFSVTVVGLLIGAVAFGLSLTRDRMYGQGLSDLQYIAAVISDPQAQAVVTAPSRCAGPRRHAHERSHPQGARMISVTPHAGSREDPRRRPARRPGQPV